MAASTLELWIHQLAGTSEEDARRSLLRRHPEFRTLEAVEHLYQEVTRLARVDLRQADRLARTAVWLGHDLKDEAARAVSLRAEGHVLFTRSRYREALRKHEAALRIFRRLARELDAGRTLNGLVQILIYLGRYGRALSSARRAKQIFARHGDTLRVARVDLNIGNLLYRQDRFEEALEFYQRALAEFRLRGEPQDLAVVIRNIAVCYISLNQFAKALQSYREARTFCEQHNMPLLVAEADYNIAYLFYLRGEYTRAIELFEAARQQSERLQDGYHRALCDLDQAEMYLELNLIEEGAELAQRAFLSFAELRMGYEAAKALVFLAIAGSHQGRTDEAMALFRDARRRFVREQNRIWPALIDLYRALVLFEAGRYREARRLCGDALHFFARTSLTNKAVLCELLLTRLELQRGRPRLARKLCLSALGKLKRLETPTLRYQALFVLGQIEESMGRRQRALRSYEQAHKGLENLRSRLSGEELKISFLKDKLALYESLVCLKLSRRPGPRDFETAVAYIESAKSRTLADLIAFRALAMPEHSPAARAAADRVRELREALSWNYRQIEMQETGQQGGSPARLARLRREARKHEAQLLRALSALRGKAQEFSSLQNGGTIPLRTIQSAIPEGTLMVEYYEARGKLYACLLSRSTVAMHRLGPAAPARHLMRLLLFQLSKFRFGAQLVPGSSELLQQATQAHLHGLYEELVGPIRPHLQARHLIVVPHDFLHYLPFHALFDGQRYLIDSFLLSYAPSASVYYLCCSKKRPPGHQSLVLGIPDPAAPHIRDEVDAVASLLPRSKLFIGAEATEERLRVDGPKSRFVHIATHGLFRQDNPMFSSIRLGNSQLTLFDLYHLRVPAELVTLSGCGTGLNVVVGGDELLGLVRGLLYAGAQALLVTLWDVSDISTADFMASFYRHLRAQPDKAVAVQMAMQQLRANYPHPYYWAPFALIGKTLS